MIARLRRWLCELLQRHQWTRLELRAGAVLRCRLCGTSRYTAPEQR